MRSNCAELRPRTPLANIAAANAANPPAMTAHSTAPTNSVPMTPKVRTSDVNGIATNIAPKMKPKLAPKKIPRRPQDLTQSVTSLMGMLLGWDVRGLAKRPVAEIALKVQFLNDSWSGGHLTPPRGSETLDDIDMLVARHAAGSECTQGNGVPTRHRAPMHTIPVAESAGSDVGSGCSGRSSVAP